MKEELREIFSNINDWLKFAEAKNFGLLSLNAAIVFGITQITFDKHSIFEPALYYVFGPLALTSFLFCMISLFPILTKIEKGKKVKNWIQKACNLIDEEKEFENIHFFGYLKNIDEDEFEQKMKTKYGNLFSAFTQYEKELTSQILYNSRIASLKYQLFKLGAMAFLLGVFLTIVVAALLGILKLL
jgi:hypothetical protein